MIKDLAAHFSSKAVRYVRRTENPEEFAEIEKAKEEINAIFSEVGEDFLIEENKLLKVSRKRIMQIQEDEDEDDESKKDGKPICNFFIIPKYRLRVFDDEQQRFKEAGLSIGAYVRINWHTYKYIELDLLNETLAGSKWINPNYLDYDYYLYRDSLYPYLLRSIWLSTRYLDDDERVLFDDSIGWVDEFFGRRESGYFHYRKDGQFAMWKSAEDPKITMDQMTYRSIVFLKSIKGLIDKSKLLPMNDSSRLQEGMIGWEDDSKWGIKFDIVKSHTTEEIKRSGKNFKVDSQLYAHLHKMGILEVEGDELKFRPDKKLSNGKRAFVLDKARLEEFLSENEIYL
ncbi:hypothetical protein [Paenibacillus sp. FSL H8-0034]|uniref:hypothetical protein n=1 Tax=Paenibacillus sp. FSL H8-0034 TaxID=2954671 RepID=UPI0030F53FD4